MAVGFHEAVWRALRNLVCALATGYILFVFSERLFWTVWRESDALVDLTVTWLAYSSAAYLFLATVSWSRADDFWSTFLAGAVYGWLIEGGLIDTLYGTQSSAPFPVSISITGLSWHALLSVMLGWWATGRALTAARPWRLVWISIAIGAFWGVWAMFPRREVPPIITPVPAFLENAAIVTLGLMVSWWIAWKAGVENFRPGWIGLVLCTLVIGLFYAQHVLKLGVLPLVVFPTLLGGVLATLCFHRQRTRASMHPRSRCFQPVYLAVLGLIPLTATLVYAGAVELGVDRIPVSTIVYYYLSGPAGFALLILSILVIFGRTGWSPQA